MGESLDFTFTQQFKASIEEFYIFLIHFIYVTDNKCQVKVQLKKKKGKKKFRSSWE